MITLGLKIGNTLISGLTFTIYESRVDEIDILVSNLNDVTSQFITMSMDNEDEQQVITGTMSENFSAALTLSIVALADNVTDVSPDLSTFLGVKSVEVELLP